jgi:hypothetical protein
MKRRILYVGPLGTGTTTVARIRALQRLRQDVRTFDTRVYRYSSNKLTTLRDRFPFEPFIQKPNADLLQAVRREQPDLIWFDKPLLFTPQTMRTIQCAGIQTLCFTQDAPFGPRRDGVWRQFKKIFPMFDLHCVFREADVARYREWGLNFIHIPFTYDVEMNFPPPEGWSDADRSFEVSYVGSPYEERPRFLRELITRHKLPVTISGPRWEKLLTPKERQLHMRGNELLNEDYRRRIWRSKINLAFLTRLNEDDISLKALEIAVCQGFLLAVRAPGHQACFEEGKEAEFFSSVEECADKIRYYLAHPNEREKIARRGCERIRLSGYDNDTQLARVLEWIPEPGEKRLSQPFQKMV